MLAEGLQDAYADVVNISSIDKTPEAAHVHARPSLQAFYSEKEAWKSERGNRYTPEELREMERNWDVHLVNPRRPICRSVD